jgi:hypothetical protein
MKMKIQHPFLAEAVALAKKGTTSNDQKTQQQAPNDGGNAPKLQRTFSAATLQTMKFAPLKYILPGLVPEGATLLVSRPKLGKSWWVLDLAVAITTGRFTLGELKPAQGDVLYLALEDGKRRLQRRITKLLPTFTGSWPEGFEFATEWRRADQGGLADIEQWLQTAKSPRLVIIDTLAQFRKLSSAKAQGYADDYAAVSGLQKLASKHSVGIIVVHHDRKNEADDVFDTVSGTLGLPAAADTVLILKRRQGAVTLHVRGRDIDESELALQFNKESCRWTILGTAADVFRSDERKRVLAVLKDAGPLPPKDIQFMAELRNRNATDILLHKMVRNGEIVRTKKGRYDLSEADIGKISGKIAEEGPSYKSRKDQKDGKIKGQDTVPKGQVETTDLSADLSMIFPNPPSEPSDLSVFPIFPGTPSKGDLSAATPPLAPATQSAPRGPAPVDDPWKDLDIPAFLDRRPPSQGADEDRTCDQCHGRVEGKERLVPVGGGRTVWLHPECVRFYLKGGH